MSVRIKLRESPLTRKTGARTKSLDPLKEENISLLKTNSLSKDSNMTKESSLLIRLMETHGPRKAIINVFNHWLDRNIKLQLAARVFESPNGITKLSNIRVEPQPDNSGDKESLITPRYCRDNGMTYMGIIKGDATFYPNKITESHQHDVTSKTYNISQEQKIQLQTSKTEKDFFLGRIPIMVLSDICMLNGLSEGQRLNLGECTNDYGGHFIIEGGERTIISQEGLRTGIFILWVDDETGKIECRITCAVDYGTTIVTMIPGSKWDTLKVGIHYAGKDKHIPLYVAFAFLNYNESNATDLICHFIPENLRVATMMYLQSSIIRGRSVGNKIIAYIINKKGGKLKGGTRSYIEESSEIIKAVQKDLFAHIKSINGKAKALAYMAAQTILAIMGEREIDNRDSWGIKKLTPPGKLMEIKLNTIWSKIINDSKDNAFKSTFKSQGIESFTQSVKLEDINNIITQFIKSFMISWTVKNGQVTESVTDSLKRDTPAATISQVTRVNAPTSRKGKKSIYREVQPSQLGGICSAETPEGETCGLVKNMGLTASISLDKDTNDFFTVMSGEHPKYKNSLPQLYNEEPLPFDWSKIIYVLDTENPNLVGISDLEDYKEIQVEVDRFEDETDNDYKTRLYLIREETINETFPYPVFINGVLVAWCADAKIEKALFRCRQFGLVPIDSCIFFNNTRKCLEIDTTGGRVIRPILVVDEGKLVIDEMDAWNYEIDTLLKNGCIMYIDSKEQEKIMLAQQISEIRNLDFTIKDLRNIIEEKEKVVEELKKKEDINEEDVIKDRDYVEMLKYQADLNEILDFPYTHCEIHSIAQFGNLAGMIPMANRTQGPRITYQASMGKQSLNQYHTMHAERFDTTFKVMTSPSIPIFQSQICIPNGLTVMPSGDTLIKAIYAHPDNPEDGIVFNRETIKSGKLKIDKYITHRLVFKKRSNKNNEIPARPPPQPFGNERYHAINEYGIPTLDVYVKTGDCVIGRMRIFGEGENVGKDQNASLYVGIGEEGYIDRVSITKSAKGGIVIKVKVRQPRNQIEGDKLASRYSQKGTASLIVDQELLPRVASGPNKGMYGDIYVNPHAIPSRMPMGEVLEMLTSKAALLTGRRIDSTTFNEFDVQTSRQVLQDRWDKHIKQHPEDNRSDIYGNKYGSRFADGYEDMELPIRVINDEEKIGQGPKFLVPSGKYRPCRRPIYFGPCYTQCLRHHVDDKFQVRSIGTIDPTSHQPIGGRARAGGQRLGEMERDALISHGATAIILERLMKVSDEFEAIICVRCGHFAVANMQKQLITCGLCKTSTADTSEDKGEFGRITFPYVFKYLIHLLALAMIDVIFKTIPAASFGTGKNLLEDRFVT